MDPILLPAILTTLAPVLAMVAFSACPVGIIWILKNHQFRMKELELEAMRLTPPSLHQLASIEARLAAIEASVAAALPRNALVERSALLEGPATSELLERVRQR